MKKSPYSTNYEGKPRSIGIEIEFAGLELEEIVSIIIDEIGGKADYKGKFECKISDTEFGEFGDIAVELDASLLKSEKLGEYLNKMGIEDEEYADTIEDFLSKAAKEVVPMEVVSPPIPLEKLPEFERVREALHKNAAQGTRDSVFHAFGLHLNPELPSLEANEIRDFLKAFVITYDWLKEKHDIDTSRRLTPYIDPFQDDYIKHILQPDYNPDIEILIDDYLEFNPTRNRPLDMLPLFTFIDEKRVTSVIDDGLTTSRPTFHYRLPNCELSDPDWSIIKEWNIWVIVERLAHSKEKLNTLSETHLEWLENPAKRVLKEIGKKIDNLF